MATDATGNVYVADFNNHLVQKFDGNGAFLTQWGSFGGDTGQFIEPVGVATDGNGNVFVTDSGNSRVQKFTGAGVYLTQWGSPGTESGQFTGPFGVATDTRGNVYVSDFSGRIQKFTGNGAFLTQWACTGYGVATDRAGNIFVANGDAHLIQKFDGNGNLLTQWGSLGTDNGQFWLPWGVATDTAGNVFVADAGNQTTETNQRVQKFDGTGNYITQWGSYGTGNRQFQQPGSLAVDASGNVFVADFIGCRIRKFALVASGVPDRQSKAISLSASPNPSSRQTTISFSLPATGPATVEIHDVLGRSVRQWSWPAMAAGQHRVSWDGRTAGGQHSAPGVLFFRLVAAGQVLERKMIRIQ
jgi:hypothetical protein